MYLEPIMEMGSAVRHSHTLDDADKVAHLVDSTSSLGAPFMQRVYVVEIRGDQYRISGPIEILSGEEKGSLFRKAAKVPLLISAKGGHSLYAPLNKYILPIYQIKLREFVTKFEKWENNIKRKIKATENFKLDEEVLDNILKDLYSLIQNENYNASEEKGTLMFFTDQNKFFYYSYESDGLNTITTSQFFPEAYLTIDFTGLPEELLKVLANPQKTKGKKGVCIRCGKKDKLYNIYSEKNKFYGTTWGGLFKQSTKDPAKNLDPEAFTLCMDCRKDYVYGLALVSKLETLLIDNYREITKAISNNSQITLKAFPVFYSMLPDHLGDSDDLAVGVDIVLQDQEHLKRTFVDKVTGLKDFAINNNINQSLARINLVYFSQANAGCQLLYILEDTVPSVLIETQNAFVEAREKVLEDIDDEIRKKVADTLISLIFRLHNNQERFIWNTYERIIKRDSLNLDVLDKELTQKIKVAIKNTLHNNWPDVAVLALEYQIFMRFINKIYKKGGFPLKTPTELLKLYKEIKDNVDMSAVNLTEEEIAFIAGCVTREFANRFFRAKRKNFLKDRVVVFGTSVGDDFIETAVLKIAETSLKNDINIIDLEKALGLVMSELPKIKEQTNQHLLAFWAGYSLFKKDDNEDNKDNKEEDYE